MALPVRGPTSLKPPPRERVPRSIALATTGPSVIHARGSAICAWEQLTGTNRMNVASEAQGNNGASGEGKLLGAHSKTVLQQFAGLR